MNGRMTKTGLFLMELVLVILFFSIASVVCLRMFAVGGLRARAAVNLSEAVVVAQSAAECFQAADADASVAAQLLNGDSSDGTVQVFYDATWRQVDIAQEKGFILGLTADQGLGKICITDENGKEIYALNVRVPGGDR